MKTYFFEEQIEISTDSMVQFISGASFIVAALFCLLKYRAIQKSNNEIPRPKFSIQVGKPNLELKEHRIEFRK